MASDGSKNLRAVSFNMHGFYQGCPFIEDLIESEAPDVLMLYKNTGSHQPNCISLTVALLLIFHSGVQPCLVVWKQVCFVEDLMAEL